MSKAPAGGTLHPLDEWANRIVAMVRARVEHPIRVIKHQFGHVKTRYRGLAKNRTQLFTLFALGKLFLVRRRLMACEPPRLCRRVICLTTRRPYRVCSGLHRRPPLLLRG